MKRFWQKRRKAHPRLHLDHHTLIALSALIFLSQLPHVLHLPFWVSALGVSIVAIKVLSHYKPSTILNRMLSSTGMTIIALGGATLVRLHYGYFLGRDPCVAFLFILVSAKFAEVRKPSDATLLLCLAGFLLLTQYFYSQSILSALITLPAVLALGNALAVIRDSANAHSTGKNVRMVAKLLLQGAPLAALLFLVFPRLPGPLWSLPDDASAKTGLSDSMSPGTIGSLSRSDAVAFRVEFKGPPPPPELRYWRGPVLNEFDGKRWTISPSSVRVNVAAPPRQAAIHYTVMMQPTQQRWLFALDHPTSLPMSDTVNPAESRVLASLTSDLQLKSDKAITQVVRYEQVSTLSRAFTPPLKPDENLTHLAGRNPKTQAFATRLRNQSQSDEHYVKQLLQHFNKEKFHYTLQPSLLGSNPVDEFLFSTRNGFCEHYASAFVVLLRAAGIPARVVTGYLGGEMNGTYMIVRQSDAHAWAEAFINKQWVRYDPTGAVAPSRVNTNMAAALGDGEPVPLMARQGNAWLKSLKLGIDEMNHDWQRMVVNFNNESQYRLWEKLGLPRLQLWQITVGVLLVTALWCLAVLGFPTRLKQAKTIDEKLWLEYEAVLARLGVKRLSSETPKHFIERAVELVPNATHVQPLGEKLVRLRFERVDEKAKQQLIDTIKRHLFRFRFYSLLNRQSANHYCKLPVQATSINNKYQ